MRRMLLTLALSSLFVSTVAFAACGGSESSTTTVTLEAPAPTTTASAVVGPAASPFDEAASDALGEPVTCKPVGWIDAAGDRADVYDCVGQIDRENYDPIGSWCMADLGTGVADVTDLVREYEAAGAEPLPCGS